MQSLKPVSKWACYPVAYLGSAGTFLPIIRSPGWVCPAVHLATENRALGSLKSSSTLVLGREFWFFHQEQWLMTFLVNVTQLVEYPLFLRDVILYFFNFKDFAGLSERTSWRIVRWLRVLWLSLHPQLFLTFHSVPSLLGTWLSLSVSILTCSTQLFNLLPRRPGLWNHHSLLQLGGPGALDSGNQNLQSACQMYTGPSLCTSASAHVHPCIVNLSRNAVFLQALQPLQSLTALPFLQGCSPSSHTLIAVRHILDCI